MRVEPYYAPHYFKNVISFGENEVSLKKKTWKKFSHKEGGEGGQRLTRGRKVIPSTISQDVERE